MQQFNIEQLNKAFDSIPPNLQSAIDGVDYQQILLDLSKKYVISIDKIGFIESRVTLTLIGLARPEDFGREIAEATGLSKEIINPLVVDINEQIFKPIRAKMMELDEYDRVIAEPEEKTPESATSPASLPKNQTVHAEALTTLLQNSPIEIQAPANIIEEKLAAPHTLPSVTTSHDLPKVAPANYKGFDPYHEPTK